MWVCVYGLWIVRSGSERMMDDDGCVSTGWYVRVCECVEGVL